MQHNVFLMFSHSVNVGFRFLCSMSNINLGRTYSLMIECVLNTIIHQHFFTVKYILVRKYIGLPFCIIVSALKKKVIIIHICFPYNNDR